MKTKLYLRKDISGKELTQFFLDLNYSIQTATKTMDITAFKWEDNILIIEGIQK